MLLEYHTLYKIDIKIYKTPKNMIEYKKGNKARRKLWEILKEKRKKESKNKFF